MFFHDYRLDGRVDVKLNYRGSQIGIFKPKSFLFYDLVMAEAEWHQPHFKLLIGVLTVRSCIIADVTLIGRAGCYTTYLEFRMRRP